VDAVPPSGYSRRGNPEVIVTTLTESAAGVYVIAVTPFADDGALDLDSIDSMVDFYETAGATGLTVLGQLGEAPKLTAAESAAVVERVLKRLGGRLPVVVGVSAPGLAAMSELAKAVMDRGAAGVMVAPPWTTKTDDQAVAFYKSVGEALGPIPFVLQDYPLTTNVTIAPGVIERIVRDVPTCVMLKHEDWPGLSKITALRAASDRGEIRRISILCGNGGLFLPEEMRRGADGAMTGFCYPEMMVGVVAACTGGDLDRAHEIFDAYLPLARYEQQPGIGLAVRKHVLAKRGVIRSAALRKPRPVLSAPDLADVELLLARQARRLAAIEA
jgi:4-hydroxy-tetrahydrodipicolinate synthase